MIVRASERRYGKKKTITFGVFFFHEYAVQGLGKKNDGFLNVRGFASGILWRMCVR